MRLVVPLLLLGACAPKARPDVAAQLTELRQRVESLEGEVALLKGAVGLPGDPAREQAAVEIAIQARAAMDAMDMVRARDLVEQLVNEYGDTQMGAAAMEVAERLAVIGSPAGKLDVVRWIRGEGSFRDDKVTLLVFFEAWCPHCQREAPSLEARHVALRDEGLAVIGVTNLSRGTTDADMKSFLDEAGITFPVAQEDGTLSQRYRVDGVPSAVLVRGGEVVWTGHPAEVPTEVLREQLKPR